MPLTYTPIATANGTGSSATISFTSIPGTYTDIFLAGTFSGTNTGGFGIVLNSNTSSVYSFTHLRGDGSTASSDRASNQSAWNVNYTGSYGTSGVTNTFFASFNNYSNTTTNKTMLSRYNVPNLETMAYVGLYRSTSAITQIDVKINGGAFFTTGTTFSLYGILAA
jgi:hypothetical protein